MQELADAFQIARQTIIVFNPDDLTVREKLRLASIWNATVEEDVAYSLIGIFKSDIIPRYGEGDAALGHLLEEIVSRSGEVTVLSWIGKSSSYNSYLPATLAVYSEPPGSSPTINDVDMNMHIATLRNSLSQTDATLIYDRITRLPPSRFANRRLYLPCIVFTVRRLGTHVFANGQEHRYRARISGIGDVEFQTSDRLPLAEPRKLILVHPEVQRMTTCRHDGHLHPFHALLLQQQPNGEFKRVATEHEIIVPGMKYSINFTKDVRTEVVEIL
ncbi:hypothetical protein L210DRAFT_3631847 [Boletus edulis BED1]|uniref:Uncharacterized protein n=1 Tax=Boletus edulis BED1 TaxID=1328754 RepID=A0AAD4BQ93_BOLED|nr:hypothetical protein L210DRAFT_3631847 [Boletus edulis BED1]